MTVREATVGPESGTTAVSGSTTSTSSTAAPRAWAAICASTTVVPWPKSVEDTSTWGRPSSARRTVTGERMRRSPLPVKPVPCQQSESPSPRSGAPSPASRAARSRSSSRQRRRKSVRCSASRRQSMALTLSRSTWPVGVTSPTR